MTLEVRRKRDTAAFRREVKILVDEQLRGALKRGESIRLEVEPGRHSVRAVLDWTSSRRVTFKSSESSDEAVAVSMRLWAFPFKVFFRSETVVHISISNRKT